jgi:hypothetical protein
VKVKKEFSTVVGYKINVQKQSAEFLYTNNKLADKETKKAITFKIATKNLVITLVEVKELYNENNKTLMKELKKTQKRKDFPCS